MAKGSSGFEKSGNGKSGFGRISLGGKSGTDKQKQYAENLAESVFLTAKANSTSGMVSDGGRKRYVSKEDADSMKGAYKIIKESVNSRKTYGEVIDLLKNQNITRFASDLGKQAKSRGKSAVALADEMIAAARKKRKK